LNLISFHLLVVYLVYLEDDLLNLQFLLVMEEFVEMIFFDNVQLMVVQNVLNQHIQF